MDSAWLVVNCGGVLAAPAEPESQREYEHPSADFYLQQGSFDPEESTSYADDPERKSVMDFIRKNAMRRLGRE